MTLTMSHHFRAARSKCQGSAALAVVSLVLVSPAGEGVGMSADDIPEPGGAFGPLMFYGPIPLYDPANPPAPGGAFNQPNRRPDEIDSPPQDPRPSSPPKEPPSTAKKFKSDAAMAENYANAGLCLQASRLADECLEMIDASITARDLFELARALDPCRFDDDGKAARIRVFRALVDRFPKSREAAIARLDLEE